MSLAVIGNLIEKDINCLHISNWTEKTDPKKFVYEDLAIASYLLCLWKQEEVKTNR